MLTIMLAALLSVQAQTQEETAAIEAIAALDAVFAKTKDVSSRLEAVAALSAVQHEKSTAKLGLLLSNEDKQVRLAAAQGLGSYSSATADLKKSAAKYLAKGFDAGINLKDVEVKVAMLNALGPLQVESSSITLKIQLDDKSLQVATAAMNAAVALRSKLMVEPLIDQLRSCEKTMREGASGPKISGKKPVSSVKAEGTVDPEEVKRDRAANLVVTLPPALQNLTGQNFTTGAEWASWWSTARVKFEVPKKD